MQVSYPDVVPASTAVHRELAEESATGADDNDDDDGSDIGSVIIDETDVLLARREFIELLRREEFGVNVVLSEDGKRLMDKQQARLGRSLERLSKDLYSKDTHFVLELVQNADDNAYSPDMLEYVLTVVLYSKYVRVFCCDGNGLSFVVHLTPLSATVHCGCSRMLLAL